jgi:hypothetical protein
MIQRSCSQVKSVALLDLSGRYVNGEVSLSWKFPPYAPEAIYIYPIYGNGSERRVSVAGMSERLLRDAPAGVRFKHHVNSPRDVTRCEFLVFLGQSGERPPELESLMDDPGYTVTVTVGSATVFYWIKSKSVENGFEKHIISLRSDYSLEQGILGYSFASVGRRFATVFPGPIDRGKHRYPPFFTYAGANVLVEVVRGANTDVQAIARKGL